jgi:hypothetical protein
LKAPTGTATRPTGARVRQTLFDVLAAFVPGSRFLDAFAGSGAVGLEALSRGAARCVLVETNDGFEIARQDLLIRGPGEFLGARQSGVPLLRFADIERDAALIEQARDAADALLQTDPAAAEAHLERWLGGKQAFIKA